jgi:DNA polymerase III subunit delta'
MTFPSYFDSKKSLMLFGLFKDFDILKNLFLNNNLPKVLMLSGKKGSGKSTLINHLMFFIFDQNNYDQKLYELKISSNFYNQFLNNIFPNIIYLTGTDFKNTKIEDIRILKKKIFKTTISNMPRFIILDDIELFNNNSLSALLKIIEEPTKNNYFILINNKSRKLLPTITSRTIDIKIILDENKKLDITNALIKKYNLELSINQDFAKLTPGNFITFNYILNENNIFLDGNFLTNLEILLNLFKKDKNSIYIDIILFLTDYYFNNKLNKKLFTNEKVFECKRYVLENINKFFLYNLNQNSLLNNINIKINAE